MVFALFTTVAFLAVFVIHSIRSLDFEVNQEFIDLLEVVEIIFLLDCYMCAFEIFVVVFLF